MKSNTNSKEIILESALALFSEKGYDGVSVNEIVQKAGITKPTLYYFYESKEGVFKAILEKKYKLLNNTIKGKSKYEPYIHSYFKDVYPVLVGLVNCYFNFVKENKTFYLMILSYMFSPPTSHTSIMVKPYNRVHYSIIEELFKDIAKVHKNGVGKEKEFAINFIAIVNASIAFWYHGHGELDEGKAKSIVHEFMHGVFS